VEPVAGPAYGRDVNAIGREKEIRMKSLTHTKFIVAGLAVGALWLAAPAAASVTEPPAAGPDTALAKSTGDDQGAGVVLRRDGGSVEPVVVDVTPASSTGGSDDGFEWGYAAIGAGVALFAAALLIGSGALGGRRRTTKTAGAVSQGS
jgi:hypothetical protein